MTFLQITNELIQDSPRFYEAPEFRVIRKNPEVSGFISDFYKWNAYALPLMNSHSFPYMNLQEMLAKKSLPYLGEIIVDLGSGGGQFCSKLLEVGGSGVIKKIFAVDIDWQSLALVPGNLKNAGFINGRVALVQSSTMSCLPIYDAIADCVLSSLGGLTYAGWWFNEKGELLFRGKEALLESLKDIYRILKPGGYVALSSPCPNPNWNAVLKESLWHFLSHGQFLKLYYVLRTGFKAKKLSTFMRQVEAMGCAHYLSVEEWSEIFSKVGFDIVEYSSGEYYSKQGVIMIAQKKGVVT